MARMVAFCNKCGAHYDAAQPHTCKAADAEEHQRLLTEWAEAEALFAEPPPPVICERCGRTIDVDGGERAETLDTQAGYLTVCTECLAKAWGLTVEELESDLEEEHMI